MDNLEKLERAPSRPTDRVKGAGPEVVVIPHVHWDPEWFATSDVTRKWLTVLFENLVKLCAENPNFRLTLDGQTMIVEDFFKTERRKGLKAQVKQLLNSGRLVVGPLFAQIDLRIADELALVKNLELGVEDTRRYAEGRTSDHVAWMIDNFGFPGQLPQLLKLFGVVGAVVWRGFNGPPVVENVWIGSDGTKLPTIFLLGGYRNLYNLRASQPLAQRRFIHEIEKLTPFARFVVPLLDGYDLEVRPEDPSKYLPRRIEAKLGVPRDLFEWVNKERAEDLSQLRGELLSGKFACTFPGTLSTRVHLKQMAHYVSKMLNTVQFVGWFTLDDENGERIDELWRGQLANLVHDNICGVCIDAVHTKMERSMRRTFRALVGILKEKISKLVTSLGLEDGTYALSLSPFQHRTIYSTGELSFNLNSSGVSLVRLNDVVSVKRPKRPRDESWPSPKASEFVWRNNHYLAQFDVGNGTLGFANAGSGDARAIVGHLRLLREDGDCYSTARTSLDSLVSVKVFKIVHCSDGDALIELRRELLAEGIKITTSERIVFDQTPIVKWRIVARPSGAGYVLTFDSQLNGEFDAVCVKMPFEVTWRKVSTDETLEPDQVPRLEPLLLAARETGPNSIFPFHGFVGAFAGGVPVFLLAHGLREYSSDGRSISLTLLRSTSWVAKDNVRGRVGDAGPMIFAPNATMDGAVVPFELGVYVNEKSSSVNAVRELYTWYSLFENPPIIFNVRRNRCADVYSTELESVRLLTINKPWLALSEKTILTYNPLGDETWGLPPFRVEIDDVREHLSLRVNGGSEKNLGQELKVEIVEAPGINFFSTFRPPNARTVQRPDDLVNTLRDLKRELSKVQEKLNELVKTAPRHRRKLLDCEYVRLKSRLVTMERKILEIKISLGLLKRKVMSLERLLWRFNQKRSQKRTYDYLEELCRVEEGS